MGGSTDAFPYIYKRPYASVFIPNLLYEFAAAFRESRKTTPNDFFFLPNENCSSGPSIPKGWVPEFKWPSMNPPPSVLNAIAHDYAATSTCMAPHHFTQCAEGQGPLSKTYRKGLDYN
ncbi:hypothetical protein NPIL_515761 [Nephila pilipes]|uniref:Uncharacterized protein n=1 Tax=Nephila pilipes TaxID=299642 RepID=A0A8X6TBR5_NEPPI|nr:hypothetical protein NPIL_515761 [Nephila pilipes]